MKSYSDIFNTKTYVVLFYFKIEIFNHVGLDQRSSFSLNRDQAKACDQEKNFGSILRKWRPLVYLEIFNFMEWYVGFCVS